VSVKHIFNPGIWSFQPGNIFSGFFFIFLLGIILSHAPALKSQNLIPAIKRDDFNQRHAWWHYHKDDIAPQDSQALKLGKGFLKLQLRNVHADKEFNVGISEFQNIYGKQFPYLSVEVRLKLLTPLPAGSRGWGFWKSRKGKSSHSLAWFMQQKEPGHSALSWSLAGTVNGKQRRVKPWRPELNTWHVYRIERDLRRKTTLFWIDDRLFLRTEGLVPNGRLSFHLWMDNQVYSRKTGIRRQGWADREAMIIDYVQIQTRRNTGHSNRISGAHVLFYKNFNRILHGTAQYDAGSYRFHSPGDSIYLLLTARAEDLRPYDSPDRLSLFLDGASKAIFTVDGSRLQGSTCTFVKKIALSSGDHILRLKAQATPLLYDILLLSADHSFVTLNVSASPAVEKEWTWTCTQAENYLLYAAVSAREAPTFDQIRWRPQMENRDDDLTLALTGSKNGFAKEITFCGNRIFGDCKTQIISGTLKPGQYRLSLQKEGHPCLQRLFLIRWPQ